MFEDVFKEMPPNLQAQQRELRALREAQGEARTAPAPPAASQAGKG
jgi:hypothetical protein